MVIIMDIFKCYCSRENIAPIIVCATDLGFSVALFKSFYCIFVKHDIFRLQRFADEKVKIIKVFEENLVIGTLLPERRQYSLHDVITYSLLSILLDEVSIVQQSFSYVVEKILQKRT